MSRINKLLRVRWVDSVHTSGWTPFGDIIFRDPKSMECDTIGWCCEDSEEVLALCQSLSSLQSADARMAIPQVAILWWEDLSSWVEDPVALFPE